MESDLKCLVICNSLETGGISSFAMSLNRAFTLFCDTSLLVSSLSLPSNLTESDNVKSLNGKIANSIFQKVIQLLARVVELRRIFQQTKFQVIYCLDPSSYILALICKTFTKCFADARIGAGFYSHHWPTWSDRFIVTFFYKYADQVVVPSQEVGIKISQAQRRFAFTIITPCLSEQSLFCDITPEQNSLSRRIVYFARISSEKRPELFIEIAERISDCQFIIYGNVSDKHSTYLSSLLDKKPPNLTYAGLGRPSLHLKRGDVLVLTSDVETFGIIITEALLHGMKVVASNKNQGPAEILSFFYPNGLVLGDSVEDWVTRTTYVYNTSEAPNVERLILDRYHSFAIAKSLLVVLKPSLDIL